MIKLKKSIYLKIFTKILLFFKYLRNQLENKIFQIFNNNRTKSSNSISKNINLISINIINNTIISNTNSKYNIKKHNIYNNNRNRFISNNKNSNNYK